MNEFTIKEEEAGQTVSAVLRRRLDLSWSAARALCETGKVFVGAERWLDPSARVMAGAGVTVRPTAPAPVPEGLLRAAQAIVYEDAQIVVVDKPAGISSVPYERGETGTAMDLIRDAWRAGKRRATDTALHVVHRIDKDTSGLLAFAKTRGAERALQALLRRHDMERLYLCVAHGRVTDRTIESDLVEDRGDGLRGSVRDEPGRRGHPQGKHAVTHVRALEFLPAATLCEVRLETGKTHQIRIHLSEAGHPLVGERVYIRDFVRQGHDPLPSPRLLLHAATLGFVHPTTGERLQLRSEPPEDFARQLGLLHANGRAR